MVTSRRTFALGALGAAATRGLAAYGGDSGEDGEVDAVVVGAGYAGSLVAKVLAEAGKRVVVLESGPAWRSKDLVSSEIWARRLRWSPAFRSAGEHPINVGYNVGWGLGGAGIHHFAAWFRMHPEDFEVQSQFGRGMDWPIGYGDLQSYYDRVQQEIGLSGDARAEVWRPPGAPYPLPPLAVLKHGRILARGFRAKRLRTSPLPMAILARRYKGRPACDYDGWCNAGCSIGALGNPLVTWIPQARKAGAEFRTGAHVLRVVMDGKRARGVEYADASGRKRELRARLVVLAAFSLETPRILLNSAEGGLANSSGLVGAYVYPHVLLTVFGLFPKPTDPQAGPTGGQLLSQDTYPMRHDRGYFGGYQWLIGRAVKPNDLAGIANARADLSGPRLEPFMRRAATHLGVINAIGYSTPRRHNRLALGEERDAYGMPLAEITHTHDADAKMLYAGAKAQGIEIMRAAGAREAWGGTMNGAHIMGGTIMGDDPRSSVATSYGQTHDIENLFIAGAGLFPSAGAANPTFTLNALTLRSAEFIRERWSELT